MSKILICLLLFFFPLIPGRSEYKFEGYFSNHDNNRLYLISVFLPYNPAIIVHNNDVGAREQCTKQWPKGIFLSPSAMAQNVPCDFLWIEDEGNEIEILERYRNFPSAKAIYTSTSFRKRKSNYDSVKKYLEAHGFVLLSHGYWQRQRGNAIFLKKDIFEAAMHTWNYFSQGKTYSVPIEGSEGIERFFKNAEDKERRPSIEGLDFIYMINLDERPEKFNLSQKDLNRYGIYPYRFSAINGWKLPLSTIRELGMPFSHRMTNERFIGTIYKEVDDGEYISNEPIHKEGEVYFSLGMSRGAIGIVMSHLSILQDAYNAGYQTIWVMEDDIEVLEDPWQISSLIRELDQADKDWDILFTDPDTKNTEGYYVPCRSIAARPNFAMHSLSYFLKHFYPVTHRLSRTGMRYGAYSMILRRSGMKKILDYFKSYRIFLPYDMDFWLIPDLRMYCPNYAVVSHRPGAQTDNGKPNYDR